jgi:uncharacterized protein (TIGR02147 family)
MKSNIFEFSSYRHYLKESLESQGLKSGLKRRAAEALGVHTTFVSQVVLGKADLSLDQAEKINQFLDHTEEEGEFFLDLLIYERASDPQLRKRYEKKLEARHAQRVQIDRRVGKSHGLSESDQEKFYSSHIYGLLHVLTSIPEYRTREKLASVLGLSKEQTNEAIDFLLKIGVLKLSKGHLEPGEKHIHLKNDSRNIERHHMNWRLATMQHLPRRKSSDLHYSLTFTCSEKDAVKLREQLLAQLQTMTATIEKSKEEAAFVYCFDFFRWQ